MPGVPWGGRSEGCDISQGGGREHVWGMGLPEGAELSQEGAPQEGAPCQKDTSLTSLTVMMGARLFTD